MNSRSFIRDSIGIFNTNIFLLIINICIGIVIARTLGVYNTGIYYSLLVIPSFIVKMGTLGLGPSLIFHIGKGKYDVVSIIKSVYRIFVFSAILAMIGLYFTFDLLNNPEHKFEYVFLLLLFLPLQFIRLLNNRILVATKQIKKSNYLRILPQAINLSTLLLFLAFDSLDIQTAILSLVFSSLCINIIYYFTLRSSIDLKTAKTDKSCVRSLLKYGFVYALSSVVLNFNYEFDIIMMERLSNFTELGTYKMGVNFAQMLQQIPAAIFPLIMIRAAYNPNKKANAKQSQSIFRISLIISLLGASFLYFIAPFIIPFFYGADFTYSATIVQIILPGILFMVSFSILSSQTAGAGKPQFAFFAFFPALIVNIVLNIFWIPKYGGAGAAWASNISYFVGFFIFTIIYLRHYQTSIIELFRFRKSDIDVLKTKE